MSSDTDTTSQASSIPLHIRQLTSKPRPRVKPSPALSALATQFHYRPSPDGIDENLLILLHGLGDTHLPFAKQGRTLNIPQTAVLALCAPQQVPFLDEPGYQWYPSFDMLGEPIARPNPTSALDLLQSVLEHMVGQCQWQPESIHFCGFAQGGSVAGEFGLKWWRTQPSGEQGAPSRRGALGSIVTICGPLLSHPTLDLSALCPTPVLVYHRGSSSSSKSVMSSYRKGYASVREVRLDAEGEAMPKGRDEWQAIMEFWSEKFGRRLDGDGNDVYEIVGGGT